MKNIILLLIGLVMISCSPQKVLKTDTQQDIDLSGRWNNTDAEIATSELYNSLIASSWLKQYQMQNELKPRIQVLDFESNFENGGETIGNFLIQYGKSDSSIELIDSNSEKSPEFFLLGEITAEEFISERENYIDYTLRVYLKNENEATQWEDKTIVKKYIKN